MNKPKRNTQGGLLGERLVNLGYIRPEHCATALAYQRKHGGLLGEALVDLDLVSRERLEAFFRDGRMARSGERLLQEGIITRRQLAQALEFQAKHGGRLGGAVAALGFAPAEKIEPIFYSGTAEAPLRLGGILLSDRLVTRRQLARALRFQRNSGGRLGEILLSMGFIDPQSLSRRLATQRKLGRIGRKLDFSVSKKLPYRLALQYNALLIHRIKQVYLLAVEEPLGERALAEISARLDRPVEQVLATKEEMERFWTLAYPQEQSADSLYKLYNEQPANSAIVTVSRGQKIAGICILVITALGLMLDYLAALLIINIVLQGLYLLFTALKVLILSRGFREQEQLKFTPEQIAAIDERELPVYTLLIPVYKEAAVVENLIQRLDALDYPKHKLDIRILLEEEDTQTLDVFRRLKLPGRYTLIIVPDTQPHTKPKACNYGLIRARGEYAVIYDAEDMPEADQLKKVFLAFRELPDSYVCVQAKLNYFNSAQNTLTRWFTQEYSTWFDVLLPGIMTLDMPLPLGGTSNHFKTGFLREVGAWDPFNVTEDADLGIRLYKMKYHTAVIDSHTWEEANSRIGNWVCQRSRWIKGYMQTWLVHMRKPARLYQELGLKGFIGYQAMMLGTPLIPILNPFFWMMLILWYLFRPAFVPLLFPGGLYFIAAAQLIFGNFIFLYANILGAYTVIRNSETAGQMHIGYGIIWSGALLPLYWVLMSVAAYKALFQLVAKPFYWEKTHHGLTEQTTLNTLKI